MWDKLSRADIEFAKQQLESRREQILVRHAEELRALDDEATDLETLDQLIGALAEKLSIGRATSGSSAEGRTQENGARLTEASVGPGVSFLITQVQKTKLRELGIAEEQIRHMKPDEAHRILGLAS